MTMFKVNILPKSLSAMVKLIKITTAKVKTTYAQKLAQDVERKPFPCTHPVLTSGSSLFYVTISTFVLGWPWPCQQNASSAQAAEGLPDPVPIITCPCRVFSIRSCYSPGI